MNPFRAVKNALRLVTIERNAEPVLELADEAEADPRLYRDVGWWRRVLIAGAALLAVLPLPMTGRQQMTAIGAKLGMIIGTVVAVAGALQSAPIPAKFQGYAALVGTFAAMIAGLYHPAPAAVTK